jgi:iron complex outermembrane receptor protein
LSRALASVPGVIVQDFFGGNDQPRIQIRGSGLQQNPVERGVLMLRNGLPLNRADGSYIVGFANPRDAQAIEIYRGYVANRLGATVLGGAINLISPTGSSAPGLELGVSGGSFGQLGGNAKLGFANDRTDLLLHGDITRRDGYRSYNDSRRLDLGGNFGVRLTDNVRARLFVNYTELAFDIAGPLPYDQLKQNPRQVWTGPVVTPNGAIYPGPNVVRDQPRRDATQLQAGARISGVFDAHIVDLLFGFTHTDDSFRFPIPGGERVTNGDDVTLVGRYAYKPDAAAPLPLFEATAQYVTGSADRDHYLNLAGQRGAQFGHNRLKADTLSMSAGLNIPFAGQFTLSPSLSWSRATRRNQDRYDLPTRPTAAYSPANPLQPLPPGAVPAADSSYSRSYTGWSPALALSWQPTSGQTVFAALSRSFEPPTHDDLFATVNGTPNSSAGRPAPPIPSCRLPCS